MDRLPIDDVLPAIAQRLRESRAVVVIAEPGAGKTTRVPPALTADGPLLLLQPRRAAARAVARRIAVERGWRVGHEVGWQIRSDRRCSADTRLLVATEGILTARAQADPFLSDFRTLVLDEFHERGIHGDLAIAFSRRAWRARDDLRLVVMSATLDAERVAAYLDDCPIVTVPGRTFPVSIQYLPAVTPAAAARKALGEREGDVLCFLSGAGEIADAVADIRRDLVGAVDVVPLHGGLSTGDQDRALLPSPAGRRVVVSTNLAETSVTVPGVTAVVDSGYHKVSRYDAARGIDSLVRERIPADSATQRAGRAGRLQPGVAYRLWSPSDRLRPSREPEILRIDLAGPVLDVMATGEDPRAFGWFEAPREDALQSALALLIRLGAITSSGITSLGARMNRLPLHPRLARIFLAGNGTRQIARACALLAERTPVAVDGRTTSCDLLTALDDWAAVPAAVKQSAAELERLAESTEAGVRATGESALRQALFSGYPDRVAQRRAPLSPRVKLATGTGAVVSPESGVRDAEFLVALDLRSSSRVEDADARIRFASAIDRAWLDATDISERFWIDAEGFVRGEESELYDEIVLARRPVAVPPERAAGLLAAAWQERQRSADDTRLLRRLDFAGIDIDLEEAIERAAYGRRDLASIRLADGLPREVLHRLDHDAPDRIVVPSGRTAALSYEGDGTVSAAVKLQELFGLADTPRVGPRRVPVTLSLLAPNGRPVQVTQDLRSFWDRTYPEVRKELRGRYPRHPWPADPWNAVPTARTNRRTS